MCIGNMLSPAIHTKMDGSVATCGEDETKEKVHGLVKYSVFFYLMFSLFLRILFNHRARNSFCNESSPSFKKNEIWRHCYILRGMQSLCCDIRVLFSFQAMEIYEIGFTCMRLGILQAAINCPYVYEASI